MLTYLKYMSLGVAGSAGLFLLYHTHKLFSVEWSDSHTVKSLLTQYTMNTLMKTIGKIQAKKFDKELENAPKVNEELLLSLLQKNKDTVYGKEHRFAEIKSKEQFSDQHPLTSYEHYEKYIARIEKGEQKILTADPVVRVSTTSGTSGYKTELPAIADMSRKFFTKGITVIMDAMFKAFPGASGCQKTLKIMFNPVFSKTSGGILKGPSSSSPKDSKNLLHLYTTPATALCEVYNEQDLMYMHLLFGLKDRKLGMLEANFSSYIYHMFIFLEHNWEKLVEDIRLGRISPDATPKTDHDLRERIMREAKITPDPKRAAELKEIFEKGFSASTCREIWPKINLILTVSTGYFAFYGEMLKSKYAGDVPIYNPVYAATEGIIGVNTNPAEASYTLIPSTMFYEFIPADQMHKPQPETKYIDDLEIGKEYELVITNLGGLCRYRFGDVIKVVGFNKTSPKIEVMYRKGQFLNLRGERLNEKDFLAALAKTFSQYKDKQLAEYACVESPLFHEKVSKTKFKTPRYMVYLELENNDSLTEKEKQILDQELAEINSYYKEDRAQGAIDQALVVTVAKGTFQKVRQAISEGGNPNQIKIPRVMRNENLIKILEENKTN